MKTAIILLSVFGFGFACLLLGASMNKSVSGTHNSFLVNQFVSRYSDALEPYVEASKLAEFKEMNSEMQSLLQGEGDLAQGLAVAINHLEHIPGTPKK